LNTSPAGAHLVTPTPIVVTPAIAAGFAANTAYNTAAPLVQNTFLGRTAGVRTIQFTNIPIEAPPGATHRFIRITNVRADASAVQPAFLQGTITVSTGTTAGNTLTMTSNAPIVGIPQTDIALTSRTAPTGSSSAALTAAVSIAQCNVINSNLVSSTTNTPGAGSVLSTLRFAELSTTAFKGSVNGIIGNRENGAQLSAMPLAGGSLALPAGVGVASSGTRLIATFTGVPSGSRLFVSDKNTWNTPNALALNAKLITAADGNGAGGAVPVGTSGTTGVGPAAVGNAGAVGANFFLLPVSGGVATATWEVINDDPAQIETLDFQIIVAAAAAAVPVGTAGTTISGSLAPISTVKTATDKGTASIPRFINSALAVPGYGFATCVTNLLFPFVTNNGILNTGVAVSNTSMDIWGTAAQAGTCSINYFGQTAGGGSVPSAQTSSSIAAGQTLLFDLKSGGMGVGATPGFFGYLIASCNFKMAHGIAFITDVNVAQLAFGYVALNILDSNVAASPRAATLSGVSENLGQ
jgi:hypothetical protein